MKTSLKLVQQAIAIQGYITITVDGGDMQCRSIRLVGGEWVTDIVTRDLRGYVRVKKTRESLTARAAAIVADEAAIRAKRAADAKRAMDWMQQS